LNEKYSTAGYIKLWIPGSINEQYLNEIRNILPNKTLLRQWFERLFAEETP
jgi:HD domain protein